MKYSLSLITFLLSCNLLVFGQGNLLLVGGGSEKDESWGWSNEPYKWAIDKSSNKTVAILTYETQPSQWLPDYFVSLGAQKAYNVSITNQSEANNESNFDLLNEADVVFIKGGDQSVYYQEYNDTRVEDALQTIFDRGGVICGTSAGMAILGGTDYTAEAGSVYPDETLSDIRLSDITLKDDFLSFKPGYLFDTHFTERGRFTRLIHFISRYYLDNGTLISGIGVDDQTALAIDENNQATAFGTGGAHFYYFENNPQITNGQLVGGDVMTFSIVDGQSVNLDDLSNRPQYSNQVNAGSVSLNKTLLIQKKSEFTELEPLLNEMLSIGDSDSLVLISNSNNSKAGSVVNSIRTEKGIIVTWLELTEASNSSLQVDLRNKIRQANHFILFEVTPAEIEDFANGQTGILLKKAINNAGVVLALVGESAEMAGEKYCTNCSDVSSASYDGLLDFYDGFNFLSSTMIIANTYDLSTDFYENNASAGHWAAMNYGLKNTVFVQDETFIKASENDGKISITVHGEVPGIVFTNNSTSYQNVSFGNDASGTTRQIVGFENGTYFFSDETNKYYAGQFSVEVPEDLGWESIDEPITGIEIEKSKIGFRTNGKDFWFVSDEYWELDVKVFATNGQILDNCKLLSGQKFPIKNNSSNMVLVLLSDIENNIILTRKVILQ
ncbi:cyanophycinase [Marinigracilibium pacificum]|uniref:Cyanophycinase n=1 Tax=Marinigracilibium pacificum TaxID=2729599 RepID=A0A848J3J9_9BACT|nr:cyanophycinase [Marinigracilibium pacificum]NMM48929.1 cyanophycinase [Marinigracilibium pacificum]